MLCFAGLNLKLQCAEHGEIVGKRNCISFQTSSIEQKPAPDLFSIVLNSLLSGMERTRRRLELRNKGDKCQSSFQFSSSILQNTEQPLLIEDNSDIVLQFVKKDPLQNFTFSLAKKSKKKNEEDEKEKPAEWSATSEVFASAQWREGVGRLRRRRRRHGRRRYLVEPGVEILASVTNSLFMKPQSESGAQCHISMVMLPGKASPLGERHWEGLSSEVISKPCV